MIDDQVSPKVSLAKSKYTLSFSGVFKMHPMDPLGVSWGMKRLSMDSIGDRHGISRGDLEIPGNDHPSCPMGPNGTWVYPWDR